MGKFIAGESQAMIRKDPPECKTSACEDYSWFALSRQKHVLDPITFFDVVVRGKAYDDYFWYMLLLLMFGLVLM